MRRVRCVVVLVLLLVGGCAADPPRSPPGALVWERCGGPGWPSTSRCADLPVPLDHAHPEGPWIAVRVSWTPAADPSHRRGVLIANPGGPGASGLHNAAAAARPAAPVRAALDGYDLVGFDPRGVGESAPVSCGLTPEQGLAVKAPSPSREGPAHDAALASSVADACARHGGPVLAHMSTADVAADVDALRAALGTPTFSYFGSSYGTDLGVVYDALFPGHLDRVVLDSMVDSEHGWFAQTRLTARTTEQRFDDFAAWAAGRASMVGLGDTPAAVRDRYLGLADARQRTPLTPVPGRVIDGALVRRATYALIGRDRFPQLAQMLRCVQAPPGDPCQSAVLRAADELVPTGPAPNDPVPGDNATSAYLGVVCADAPWPHDPAVYQRAVAEDATRYPVTAGGFAMAGPCASWPVPARPAVTAAAPAARPDQPRFLLLNNTHDRISDLDGALSTRTALGPRARFVTVEGWNHQVLGNHDPCADAAVAAWLGDGRLPDGDVRCPASG